MVTFYFIRHPQTVADEGVCYGVSDLLPREGEVNRIANEVRCKIDLSKDISFVSSPLLRCYLLAEALADGKVIKQSNLVKEIDFGSWEMQKWNELPKEEQRIWSTDFINQAPYGGENFTQVIERAKQFWDEQTDDLTHDKIIVTHAGLIRALLVHLLEASPYKVFATDVQYGDVIKVDVHSKEYYKIRFM